MDLSIESRLEQLELSMSSHFTVYNYLFKIVFTSLLNDKYDDEFEKYSEHMLNVFRFNMKNVLSAMHSAMSM